MVFEFLDLNGLSHRLSKEKKVAGKGWMRDMG
jgi:hypothetical protein